MVTSTERVTTNLLALPASIRPRPRPEQYGPSWSCFLLLSDVCVIILAGLAAQQLVLVRLSALLNNVEAGEAVLFALLTFLLLFARIGMYRRSYSSQALDEVYASLAASALAMAPALVIFLILPTLQPFRHLLILGLAIAAVGVSSARLLMHALRTRIFPPAPRLIAVVGAAARVAAVPRALSLGDGD